MAKDIGGQSAIVLRALLAKPEKPQYCLGLAKELGLATPTVRNALYKLEDRGWLASSVEPRGRYSARRFYSLTPAGRREGRAELKTWDFKDELPA